MEWNDPEDIPVEYADVYSSKQESSTDNDDDSDTTSTEEKNRSETSNAYQNCGVGVTIRAGSNDPSAKRPSNRKAPSMYDEDLYALPENALEEDQAPNCQAQRKNNSSCEPKSVGKGNGNGGNNSKKCCFLVFVPLLTVAGGGVAIYFTTSQTGTMYTEVKC